MDVCSNQRREYPTANEYEGHSAMRFPCHLILERRTSVGLSFRTLATLSRLYQEACQNKLRHLIAGHDRNLDYIYS